MQAYGAEAGVACLKWLPYGGLYLTGGLTPKNIDLIADPKVFFMPLYFFYSRSDMVSKIMNYLTGSIFSCASRQGASKSHAKKHSCLCSISRRLG